MNTLVKRMFCNRAMKQKVPASDAAKATPRRNQGGAPAVSNIASITPKRHHASVPAVVGETNLLFVRVCMMMPEMASPAPVRMIASVRGMRLMKPIKRSAPSPAMKPDRLKSCTPVCIERMASTHNISDMPALNTAGLFHLIVSTAIGQTLPCGHSLLSASAWRVFDGGIIPN